MRKEHRRILRKVLGVQEKSHTTSRVYTLFLDEKGYTCDCPDFQFRNGSHQIEFRDEEGRRHGQRGCKHIASYLSSQGLEVTMDGIRYET